MLKLKIEYVRASNSNFWFNDCIFLYHIILFECIFCFTIILFLERFDEMTSGRVGKIAKKVWSIGHQDINET